MSRFLPDMNIISNVTKAVPSESLLAWMAEQADETLYISALTVAEIRRGVLEKPPGRKRDQLERGSQAQRDRRHCLPVACCHLTRRQVSSGRASWRTAGHREARAAHWIRRSRQLRKRTPR